MVHPDRFRDFLEQNCFANARRRNNQSALTVTERRKKIDAPSADRVGFWILEHDPALREFWSEFFEIGRLGPFLGRFAFNRKNVIEHETFLAVARKAQLATKLLPGAQTIELDCGSGNVNVFRDWQEIQLRITQHSKRITDLIEKPFTGNRRALAERGARNVENMIVPRARGMQMEIEVARDGKKIVELFQLVDAQLSPSRTGDFCCSGGRAGRFLRICSRHGPSRTGISLYTFVYFVHFS